MAEGSKEQLRKSLLQKRRSMPVDKWQSASAAICKHLADLFVQQELTLSAVVGCYVPILKEPDLRTFLTALPNQLCLPYLKDNQMDMRQWSGATSELERGPFQTWQPRRSSKIVVAGSSDVLLIPAVGASIRGYRIGYGAGYYDRYLAALESKPTLIYICFHDALVELPNPDNWDVPSHFIVTDQSIIHCNPHNRPPSS